MTEKRSSRMKPILGGVAVLVVLGLVAGGYWWFELRGVVSTDDARLSADLVDLSAEIPARITEVDVDVGDHVTSGEVLFRLDRQSLEVKAQAAQDALNLAQTRLAAAQANLDKARHGPRPDEIRMAEASVRRLAAQVHLAELSLDRAQKLHAAGSAARSAVDKATAELDVARSSEAQAKEQLALLKAGTRKEDIAALQAQVKSAEAGIEQAKTAMSQAKIALGKTEVVAPFDGVVVRRWRDPGDMAAPGAPVLTLFDPSTLRVEANVEETSLAHVAPGAKVDISVDAYPQLHLTGRVATVVRATQAQLSPIPSEGTSGTFIKVTQRVPVRIHLADLPRDEAEASLLPGLSVEVRIHEGGPKTGAALADKSK